MTDRGLYARWLYREIVALGWHPVMRITKLSKFRKRRVEGRRPGHGAGPAAGSPVAGPRGGLPQEARAAVGMHAPGLLGGGLRRAVVPGDRPGGGPGREPVVRDEVVDRSAGYKLLKSGGWQWQATRMTDRDRVERLWLVLAVATWYVLAMGGEADEAEFADGDGPRAREPIGPGGHRAAAGIERSWAGSAAPSRCPEREHRREPAAAATDRDERAPGQRVPSRLGGVVERADRRSCVAEALMETRSVVGITMRDHARRPSNLRLRSPKTPPSEGGLMEKVYRLFDRRCRTATALAKLAKLWMQLRGFVGLRGAEEVIPAGSGKGVGVPGREARRGPRRTRWSEATVGTARCRRRCTG